MKTFRVGGAVRDALLGLPVQDIDYVVVGSTPEHMIAQGFTPVGKDFPVFLHPQTHAEYALARSERKSAPGYHGFVFHCSPEVTLEEDLQRRDLTINAMAVADDASAIIDPFNGQADLIARVFRHVSNAFAEDPVRILRLARFAARFHQFTTAPETMQLMRTMVEAGEVDALVPERVWQEVSRGLMEERPSRMLQVLHECGALEHILPELHWPQLTDSHRDQLLKRIDFAAAQNATLAVRWASLMASYEQSDCRKLCERVKVPVEVRDVSLITNREHQAILDSAAHTPEALVTLLERCDALRRATRFAEIIEAVRCFSMQTPEHFPQQALLELALTAAQSIPGRQIAEETAQRFPKQPGQIAKHIFLARVEAVAKLPGFAKQ
jgi:tRNA nucleotidyltransferase (CCA-adding enzyme)